MKRRAGLQALALLLLAIACALVSNALAGPERRLAWVGTYAPDSRENATPVSAAVRRSAPPAVSGDRAFSPHPDKPFVEISGEDTAFLHSRGNVVFLDARRTAVYREGHIAEARPFSVWESDIDDKIRAFFAEGHDPSAPIVVYCSGGECEDSHMLAQKLYLTGFDDVLVYKDGFPDWEKRGLAIHKGSQP